MEYIELIDSLLNAIGEIENRNILMYYLLFTTIKLLKNVFHRYMQILTKTKDKYQEISAISLLRFCKAKKFKTHNLCEQDRAVNFFTLDVLNFRKQHFNYGSIEFGDISSPIKMSHLKKLHLKMSAREMMIFLMVGDLVPEDDEVWKFFLIVLEIIEILISGQLTQSLQHNIKHKINSSNNELIQRNLGFSLDEFNCYFQVKLKDTTYKIDILLIKKNCSIKFIVSQIQLYCNRRDSSYVMPSAISTRVELKTNGEVYWPGNCTGWWCSVHSDSTDDGWRHTGHVSMSTTLAITAQKAHTLSTSGGNSQGCNNAGDTADIATGLERGNPTIKPHEVLSPKKNGRHETDTYPARP
ncbi:hypothetical protein AGLY_018054 [Aphis glycines]|uniref:Uncharacterized protein n=1 Tax=Aphis glycines TaxID=307491 RepID=A0A6G0SUA9_APHGL|nr:hypothetical protein AGLY_018054 [Aphis glycines]